MLPGSHSQKGRGDTGNWRGLWEPSGKTRSSDFRPCLHQQEHHCLSIISISVDNTAQRTCPKAIPLWRKVPPAAAVPFCWNDLLGANWVWTRGYKRMGTRAGAEPCTFPSEVKTSRGNGVAVSTQCPTELSPGARSCRTGAARPEPAKGMWELIWQSTNLDQEAELLSRDSFFSEACFRHHNPYLEKKNSEQNMPLIIIWMQLQEEKKEY